MKYLILTFFSLIIFFSNANAYTTKLTIFGQKLNLPFDESKLYNSIKCEYFYINGKLLFNGTHMDVLLKEKYEGNAKIDFLFGDFVWLKRVSISASQCAIKPGPLFIKKVKVYDSITNSKDVPLEGMQECSATFDYPFNEQTDYVTIDLTMDKERLENKTQLRFTFQGIESNSLYKIVHYLIATRNDAYANEDFLFSLVRNGYTALLHRLQFETFDNLYLPPYSIFYLPCDANVMMDREEIKKNFINGVYMSRDGSFKSTVPKNKNSKNRLLYIDKSKIRFLKKNDLNDVMPIKKVDLAK